MYGTSELQMPRHEASGSPRGREGAARVAPAGKGTAVALRR